MIPDIKIALISALITGALGLTCGYKVADWRLTGEYTAEKLEAAQASAQVINDMITERDDLSDKLSAANDKHSLELREAQDETNHIRDRLHADRIRLRIAATCQDSSIATKTTSGASVDIRTGAELDATSRQDYFSLRDGINQESAQLAACQDELKLRTFR